MYARVYRSINHNDFRDRSNEARVAGSSIARFADAVVQLQRARHEADYNPVFRISKADAIGKVQTARDAIATFEMATVDEQVGYLTRVLYKERRA
jgi:hypothetical protein